MFSGCPYGPDDVWAIIWPNTPGGSISSQPCPGGVDAVGMLYITPHIYIYDTTTCGIMHVTTIFYYEI